MTACWVGGYTMAGRGGVRLLESRDEDLADGGLAAETADPSFLLRSPVRPDVLYAVDEGAGAVLALAIGAGGTLRRIGRSATAGGSPCHLALVDEGRTLLAACYADGVVSAHAVGPDGAPGPGAPLPAPEPAAIGPHPAQDGPHAHACLELGDLLLVADLGTDRVLRYRRDGGGWSPTGAIALPAGAGPRDLLAHPSGRVLVLGEHDARIHVLDGDRLVASVPATTDPVPHDQAAGMTLGGTVLTAGLRGSDRIAVLRVGADGVPEPAGSAPTGGRWPRHHVRDGAAVLVANERSGSITRLPMTADGTLGAPDALLSVPAPTFLLPRPA